MIEKLKAIKEKFEALTEDIANPEIIADTKTWQAKVKEHSSLQPLIEEYDNYIKLDKDFKDASELLEVETDAEMKDMLKEEILSLKDKLAESEDKLKVLLLPKDENDTKNVILEIRGGAGGEEAATSGAEGSEADIEKFRAEHPLLAILNPIQNQGPVVGYSLSTDTAKVNRALAMKQIKDIFPADVRFRWTVKAVDPNAKQLVFQLVAIKLENPRSEKAPLEGSVITDARSDFDQYSASATVSMKMNCS